MKRLIFVHIAKTGGTSIRNTIPYHLQQVLSHEDSLEKTAGFVKKTSKPFLIGHIPYGLHKHLDDECEYLTVLRHPVERVFSKMSYTPDGQKPGLLSDFMTGGFSHAVQNLSVKQLCGYGLLYNKPITEEDYNKALENLKTFKYIGFMRKLSEVFDRLKADYKLPGAIGHSNKSGNNRLENIDKKDIELVKSYNEWDVKLFEEAKRLSEA